MKKRLKEIVSFFHLLFGCQIWAIMKEAASLTNINHCLYSNFDWNVTDGLVRGKPSQGARMA